MVEGNLKNCRNRLSGQNFVSAPQECARKRPGRFPQIDQRYRPPQDALLQGVNERLLGSHEGTLPPCLNVATLQALLDSSTLPNHKR
jgi:hypothetical protein